MNLKAFRAALLRWFSRTKRPLPWRKTRDAYAIWVSEVMLQQTTVATVTPFYERFMKCYPTVRALAAADEDAVLSLWSGLGYYSRARNLRLAASEIVENHGGRFPKDIETAMTLRGVGRYTASAVASIAYGTRAAVVDGNVRRVLSRIHARRGLSDGRIQEMASQLLSPRAAGSWNEAMMELGATICTPRRPQCNRCPVSSHCRGQERSEYWSQGKPRRAGVRICVRMALVEHRGRILLTRNVPRGLMAGLYELPHEGLPAASKSALSLSDSYRGVLDIEESALATIRHSVTHYRIVASIFRAKPSDKRTQAVPGENTSFHTIDDALRLPLGGLTRKALRAVGLITD